MASLYNMQWSVCAVEREWNAFRNKSSFDIATRLIFLLFAPSKNESKQNETKEQWRMLDRSGRWRRQAIICILITQLLFNTILIIFHFHYH